VSKQCPLLKKACVEHACAWYTHIIGNNPQTNAAVDAWDCAVNFMPLLLIESSKMTRAVGASVDSMRNEVVARQDQLNNAVALGQREAAKRIGEEECKIERLPKAT